MPTLTDEVQTTPAAEPPSDIPPAGPAATGNLRRFRRIALGAILAACVPYLWVLWVLWGNGVNPLRVWESRTVPGSVIYDVQARAMLHGHLSLPNSSIGDEAFIHHGRTYTYFGILPSLIRMPVLLFTHAFDGRLTGLSMLVSWMVTALFATMLLWRLRILVRGEAPLGWAEGLSYGTLVFSILAGSVLVSLASTPNAYCEDEAWGVALACGSLFALLGVVERPSWGRVTACGLLVLLTNLNRATTGYACVLGTLLVAAWFFLGRAGPHRRRWALPVLGAALIPLVVGCTIDYAKFDVLFGFPASEQLLYKVYGFSHINGGKHFSLHFLPATLQGYLSPGNLRFTRVFPYLTFPELSTRLVAHTRLFNRGSTSSLPASMPLLFGLGLWGTITTFGPHRPMVIRSLRILILTAAASGGAMLIYGTIYERFLADFMPLLILASSVGMVDIWRRLDGKRRPPRILVPAGIVVVALFGFVANMGVAIAPQEGWDQTQTDHYVETAQTLSNITGHPLEGQVVRAENVSTQAPIGQLLIRGDCDELYISDGQGSAFPYLAYVWLPVERSPDTPLCHALIGTATNASPRSLIVTPLDHQTVSGARVAVAASASGGGKVTGVTFVFTSSGRPGAFGKAHRVHSVWTLVWDSRTVPNGTYTLRSAAFSAAGYTGISPAITMTVDNPTRAP